MEHILDFLVTSVNRGSRKQKASVLSKGSLFTFYYEKYQLSYDVSTLSLVAPTHSFMPNHVVSKKKCLLPEQLSERV